MARPKDLGLERPDSNASLANVPVGGPSGAGVARGIVVPTCHRAWPAL